ncbi:hypothetical protein ABEB36_007742 [Hypothenemus hampei]|uniref:Vesicular, overexpressed in cancer, prosurvival protein 1 n=1 Tax=Hypothenemus hampei TaxID=57062 RepID=A0ABD1EV03_HYPHA
MTEPLPCILYNKHLNITLKYKCNFEEICCDHEDGCCPIHPVKYYESWYFWVFVLVILVSSYLLCWYCKKLEKRRQRITEQGRTGILPFVRTINEDNIDQLLETFALHYGIRKLYFCDALIIKLDSYYLSNIK